MIIYPTFEKDWNAGYGAAICLVFVVFLLTMTHLSPTSAYSYFADMFFAFWAVTIAFVVGSGISGFACYSERSLPLVWAPVFGIAAGCLAEYLYEGLGLAVFTAASLASFPYIRPMLKMRRL